MDQLNDAARTGTFERHRRLLFSIAYRMLGSVADAEDTVQEAFVRWHGASGAGVRSPKALLVTITSRLCIDHLKSARVQREVYVGARLPEASLTEPGDNVSRIAQVAESVSTAMLLILERLTPVERAVFLLNAIFDYAHAEIAARLGLSESNCRQLLRRARQRIHRHGSRFSAPRRKYHELLRHFRRAVGAGDMDGLLVAVERRRSQRDERADHAGTLLCAGEYVAAALRKYDA